MKRGEITERRMKHELEKDENESRRSRIKARRLIELLKILERTNRPTFDCQEVDKLLTKTV